MEGMKKEHSNTSIARSMRKRAQRLMESGLCRSCGKCAPKESRTLCEDCLVQRRILYRVHRHKAGLEPQDRFGRGPKPAFQGACEICQCILDTKKAKLDHCHTQMVFRGWLCNSCNVGLGLFRDSPLFLGRAIAYLERSINSSPIILP